MPETINELSDRALARHIDAVRRRTTPLREGLVTRELAEGAWLSAIPGAPAGDVPSSSMNRAYWLDPGAPVRRADFERAAAEFAALGCKRAYFWVAPWAWDAQTEQDLSAIGGRLWPHVEYIALARRAEAMDASGAFAVRRLEAWEERAIGPLAAWYGAASEANARRCLRAGAIEVFVAEEKGVIVAIGLLTPDGNCGYIGAATTDPAFRGRGAQKQLIAARVARVAQTGGRWATVETNTMVPISLDNLRRSGFADRIAWRVCCWERE